MIKINQDETIAAIATPPGRGAIGVIRVSGSDAIKTVNKIFKGKDLDKVDSHTLHFGKIVNESEVIDEVLVSIFKAPKSYTGDNLVEISCHGSQFVLGRVLALLNEKGVRNAEPGEFTLRAFMNKKLDLSQAEAVIDIIDSESEISHKVAMNQMRGGFSETIRHLRQKLVDLISLFELELDFAEEDVEFATNQQLMEILEEVKNETKELVDSFKLGNVIKKGVSVVIAGKPNAGKSTLLNALLQEERAIISDIPGTTRDFIEDVINIKGIDFRFTDTAGLTETIDEIERIGISRTIQKLEKADVVIYLFDVATEKLEDIKQTAKELKVNSPLIMVGNKVDKIPKEDFKAVEKQIDDFGQDVLLISSKMNENLDALKEKLIDKVDLEKFGGDMSVVTNVRHYDILRKILAGVEEVEDSINQNITKDFIAIDVRSIISLMSEITGEITNDEILGTIFSRFCIGK